MEWRAFSMGREGGVVSFLDGFSMVFTMVSRWSLCGFAVVSLSFLFGFSLVSRWILYGFSTIARAFWRVFPMASLWVLLVPMVVLALVVAPFFVTITPVASDLGRGGVGTEGW